MLFLAVGTGGIVGGLVIKRCGLSGVVQPMMGCPVLFILSSTAGLLTLAIIPFLPMPDETR